MSEGLLPPVVAELRANITEFKEKMAEARGEVSSTTEEGGGKFSKFGAVAAAGIAVAAAAAISFAKSCVEKFEESAGAVARMQRLTGESAESMSHLAFAAQETGVSQDKLEGALKKMSKAVESNSKAFADHNIQTKDANGNLLPMSQIIANASDLFASMPDGIEKNALAMQMFGKSGTDLIPLLDQGKAGLEKFGEEADKFGVTLGQKNVDDYKKNLAAHREMHAAWEGLQIQIGEKLMPVIAKITAWLAENLPTAIAFVKKVVDLLEPSLSLLGIVIQKVSAWLGEHKAVLYAVGAAMALIIAPVPTIIAAITYAWQHFETFRDIVRDTVAVITAIVKEGVDLIMTAWHLFGDDIVQYLQGAWEIVSGIFKGAFEVIEGIFDFFKDLFTGNWSALWGDVQQIVQGFWDAITGIVHGALDGIEAIMSAAWTAVKLAAAAVWDGIKLYFELWWKAVKLIVTTEVNLIKDAVMLVFDGIRDGISAVWDAIKLTASTVWDGIKMAVTDPIGLIKSAIQTVIDLVGKIWDGVESTASAVWNNVKAAIDVPIGLIKGAIGGVAGAVKGMWNDIAHAWNSTVGSFGFSIPSWVPGFGGDSFHMPQLPTFHQGGVVPGAPGQEMLALVKAGETVRTPQQEAALSNGPTVLLHNTYQGITDFRELARHTARETAWALKAA